MPYLLNKNRGATVNHPELGIVPPLTAIEITPKQARNLKGLVNTIIFNDIIKREEEVVVEKKKEEKLVDLIGNFDGDIEKAIKENEKQNDESHSNLE